MTGRLVALGVLLSVVVGCGTPTATIDAGTNELAPVGVGGGVTVLTADDRAEIRDLAGRYSHALDLGDVSAWSEVFTVDGVMEMEAQGYNITGDALWSLPSGNVDRSAPQSRHIPTTFVIEGAEDDATMRSYVTVVGTGEGANIVFQGRYEDRLRRVDGRWRIAHRKIITDWIEPEVAKRVAAAP